MDSNIRLQRMEARYHLRANLRRITSLRRLKSCGLPLGGELVIRVKEGLHYYAGISTCGSGWACPVCANKIRYRRAHETSQAIIAAVSKGMAALFVTRTIPHTAEDSLGVTLGLLAEGRRFVMNQPVVKGARQAAGYLGAIAAKEITYGNHGWHAHSHDIEFYLHELSLEHFANISRLYYEYLDQYYSRHGFHGLSRQHGVQVEQVQLDSTALARYVAKVQEGAYVQLPVAQELTRMDTKYGRQGARLPFDIARAFCETGDMELLALWHEYERATFGRSVIRFTPGLRALLLPREPPKTDEELAAQEVNGSDVVRFEGWLYRKLAKVPGLEGRVLAALDSGGFPALVELLTAYQLDESGYRSIADTVNV